MLGPSADISNTVCVLFYKAGKYEAAHNRFKELEGKNGQPS